MLPVAVLCGCTVRLIAPYDSTLDNSMTEVQADTEAFLIRLGDAEGTDAARFAGNREFYAREEGRLRTLVLRAQAVPKSELVADQILSIEKTFEIMERMHRRDGELNVANLAGERAAMESEFRSFFVLELALKNHTGRSQPTTAVSPAAAP